MGQLNNKEIIIWQMDHSFNLEMVLDNGLMHLMHKDLHLLEGKFKMEQFKNLFLGIMNELGMQWELILMNSKQLALIYSILIKIDI